MNLNQLRENIYTQHGEDGIIRKVMEIIPNKDKWCVEFGAWDGMKGSNTYRLIKDEGYKAVLIEGNQKRVDQLNVNMASFDTINICKYIQLEGDDSLDAILSKTPIPKNFDFISIDIDGNDYHIWNSFKNYKPKIVVIEFNPTIPNEVHFVQERDFTKNHGNSARALVELGKEKGYELIATTLNNLFFVDKEYFPLFEIEDNSLYKIRDDLSRVTYIFNGYDGKVFIDGYKKIDMENMPYRLSRLQHIPRVLREFETTSLFKKIIKSKFKSLRKRGII